MTLEQFLVDAVRNPGKIYEIAINGTKYRWRVVRGEGLQFQTQEQNSHHDWGMFDAFPEGDYQPVSEEL